MKTAIIDMGTNTFHLLVAEIGANGFDILLRERIPVRIGVGGINQGVVTEAAVIRAIDGLMKFRETLNDWPVEKVFAFGTSALRNARNGNEVVSAIRQAT